MDIAEEIICFVCKCSRSDIYLNKNLRLTQSRISQIKKITSQMKTGKPLAYCVNSKYFYDREFFVDENVLIPRSDTEILIETILKNENSEKKLVLELGTGSGIIPQILRSRRENWQIVSVDISLEAAEIAKKNCDAEILIVNCDKFSAIKEENVFDLIVSNPPYIESREIEKLDVSVRDFEPKIALDGGEYGLDFYEYLAKTAKKFIKESGKIYCEIGYNQDDTVPKIFEENDFTKIRTVMDLGNNPRVVSFVPNKRNG